VLFILPLPFRAPNSASLERLFPPKRRSPNVNTLQAWLLNPGPVLLRTFVRLHSNTNDVLVEQVDLTDEIPLYNGVCQCFSTFLLQWNLPQMFALLMEPYAIMQVSILGRAGFK